MGQNQILLVVLVTVIVSIATIVAINMISKPFVQETEDELGTMILKVASDAEAYWHKHKLLGGGSHSFEDLTFNNIPCPLSSEVPNGHRCMNPDTGETIVILPKRDSVLVFATIQIQSDQYRSSYVIYPDGLRLKSSWAKR